MRNGVLAFWVIVAFFGLLFMPLTKENLKKVGHFGFWFLIVSVCLIIAGFLFG